VILLDPTCTPGKKNFVKLHEVGHKVLPWQRQSLVYVDDDVTLDPETKDRFEREASFFASEVLFQCDRFDREARDLPLGVTQLVRMELAWSDEQAEG
jgi:Zn-dependent peptidase ImmA (M78 family)